MRIAVAGGTGVVGRYAVEAAEAAGHETVTLARSRGVDLRTGSGLETALEGVDVVIDATNTRSVKREAATEFFVEATRRLHAAGAAQGASRLVTQSIVGVDRVSSYGYYAAKLRHEEAARSGPLPAVVVRATQFHEFPVQVLARSRKGPVALIPTMRMQPVAARTVGALLVEMAVVPEPADLVEVAGPSEEDLVTMARLVLRRRGLRAVVVPVPVPGAAGRAMRGGGLLPGPGARRAGPDFASWLDGEDAGRSLAELLPVGRRGHA